MPADRTARPLVYDPFHGSGTTMQVAIHMGFDAIGSEANEKYIALSEQRITQRPKCLQPKKLKRPRVKKCKRQGELFSPCLSASVVNPAGHQP